MNTTSSTSEKGALLIGARATAKLLGVSTRTVSNYVERGVLVPVHIKGSPPRFRVADIERLVEKGSTS
jgi:predicted site-specific integrase-resolvase